MARSNVGPWFKTGVDILFDTRLLRLEDKADRHRYSEMCALAKLSVDYTRSDEEIGRLLAGEGEPMTVGDIARRIGETPEQVEAFLERLVIAMPSAVRRDDDGIFLCNFAKRQYDYRTDMPHYRSAMAPQRPHKSHTASTQTAHGSSRKATPIDSDSDSEKDMSARGTDGARGRKKSPTPEGFSECIRVYCEAYKAATGANPRIDGGDGDNLKAVLRLMDGGTEQERAAWPAKVQAAIGYAMSGKYPLFAGQLPALKSILAAGVFNPLLGAALGAGGNGGGEPQEERVRTREEAAGQAAEASRLIRDRAKKARRDDERQTDSSVGERAVESDEAGDEIGAAAERAEDADLCVSVL